MKTKWRYQEREQVLLTNQESDMVKYLQELGYGA
jgi:hypothetical protein